MKEIFRGVFIFLAITSLLFSCSNKRQAFVQESNEIIEQIVSELENIETIEDVIAAKGRLEQEFLELVDVIIKIRSYDLKHKNMQKPQEIRGNFADELYTELNRVLQIPGAQQIIEVAERPALEKLDAFEKKKCKK